jgi:hypothetical protein
MTLVFSIFGLYAYHTGKMHGNHGYIITGPGIRILGLMMVIIDWLPVVLFVFSQLSSGLSLTRISPTMNTLSGISFFFSPLLNILVMAFAFLFHKLVKD